MFVCATTYSLLTSFSSSSLLSSKTFLHNSLFGCYSFYLLSQVFLVPPSYFNSEMLSKVNMLILFMFIYYLFQRQLFGNKNVKINVYYTIYF